MFITYNFAKWVLLSYVYGSVFWRGCKRQYKNIVIWHCWYIVSHVNCMVYLQPQRLHVNGIYQVIKLLLRSLVMGVQCITAYNQHTENHCNLHVTVLCEHFGWLQPLFRNGWKKWYVKVCLISWKTNWLPAFIEFLWNIYDIYMNDHMQEPYMYENDETHNPVCHDILHPMKMNWICCPFR